MYTDTEYVQYADGVGGEYGNGNGSGCENVLLRVNFYRLFSYKHKLCALHRIVAVDYNEFWIENRERTTNQHDTE